MPYDDEQYLDNPDEETVLDDEEEEEQDDAEDEDESSDEPPRKGGNLAVALQEERRRRREMEEQYRRLEDEVRSMQQNYQAPSPERLDEINAQISEKLFNNPLEVLDARDRALEQRFRQQYAPMLAVHASTYLANHPEHQDLYAKPKVRAVLEGRAKQLIATGEVTDLHSLEAELDVVAKGLRELAGDFVSHGESSGKKKLTSTVGRGGNGTNKNRSAQDIWEEKAKLPAHKYDEWTHSAEGKQVLRKLLRGAST